VTTWLMIKGFRFDLSVGPYFETVPGSNETNLQVELHFALLQPRREQEVPLASV
jgi:hypothetical protein